MEQVVVLNADNTFLNTIHWQKAVKLVWLEKVEVVKNSCKKILTASGLEYTLPKVIRLIEFVGDVVKKRVAYSKGNLFVRDSNRCQYCGKKLDMPTIDHIVPKSRGGKSNFKNCVTCCTDCNQTKGNRTPEEANMRLIRHPQEPTIAYYISLTIDKLSKEIKELIREV